MTEEKSFWHTVPGILTGIAGVITAVAGLVLALHQVGCFDEADNGSAGSGPTTTVAESTTTVATTTSAVTSTIQQLQLSTVNFTGYTSDRFLNGQEFQSEGIDRIEAAPVGGYCDGASVAIRKAGSYRAPFSFLTTAAPGAVNTCNGVPVRIRFSREVREVQILFYGADSPYELSVFSRDGVRIQRRTQNASPYDYSRAFELGYAASTPVIQSVTFGHSAALTIITEIRFQ